MHARINASRNPKQLYTYYQPLIKEIQHQHKDYVNKPYIKG